MISLSILNNKFDKGDLQDLLSKTFKIPLDFEYEIAEVDITHQFRPDLISTHTYGDPNYMDVICKLNGICDIFDIRQGVRLVLPTFEHIHKFYMQEKEYENTGVNNIQKSSNTSSNINNGDTPSQKQKFEPRKANQQLVGDKNFRINKDSKIIIY